MEVDETNDDLSYADSSDISISLLNSARDTFQKKADIDIDSKDDSKQFAIDYNVYKNFWNIQVC